VDCCWHTLAAGSGDFSIGPKNGHRNGEENRDARALCAESPKYTVCTFKVNCYTASFSDSRRNETVSW